MVFGSGTDLAGISASLREVLDGNGIRIQDLAGRVDPVAHTYELDIYIRCRNLLQAPELLSRVAAVEGVSSAEWEPIGS